MIVDDALESAIVRQCPAAELQSVARAAGMRTLFDDGLDKVAQGLTTVEQVLLATRMGEETEPLAPDPAVDPGDDDIENELIEVIHSTEPQ